MSCTENRFQFPRDFEPREVLSPEGRTRLKKAERVIATIVRVRTLTLPVSCQMHRLWTT